MATPTLTFAKLAEEPHLSDIYSKTAWLETSKNPLYIYIEIDVRSMNV